MEYHIKQSIEAFGVARGRPYSPSSIKIYCSNIKNLHVMCNGHDESFTSLSFLSDYKKVEEVLGDLKMTTRRNYLNAVLVALHSESPKNEMLITYYAGKRDVMNFKTSQLNSKTGLTDSQTQVFQKVSKGNIDALILSIDPVKIKYSHYDLMMYMLLLIHRAYPLRNECGDMKFIKRRQYNSLSDEGKKETNWILLDASGGTGVFILSKYKTSKVYGTKEFPVSAEIMPVIRLWLKQRQIKITDIKDDFTPPFLCFSNGNGMTRNALSHKFSDYTKERLGAPISTTLMAKYYSIELDMESSLEDIEKAQLRADMRGHSMATQMAHYQVKSTTE
tara:strand:- start:3930 stop:4928 length:999 start_codon:yes stop_codon:yes gene_type:complete